MKWILIVLIGFPVVTYAQKLSNEEIGSIVKEIRAINRLLSPDTCDVKSYQGDFENEKRIGEILKDSIDLSGLKDCEMKFIVDLYVNCDGQLMGRLRATRDDISECSVEFARRVSDVIMKMKFDPPMLKERPYNALHNNERIYLRYDYEFRTTFH